MGAAKEAYLSSLEIIPEAPILVCPNHPDLLPHIKTLDVPQPHIAQAKCECCDGHIKWLSRQDALKLIEFCPTDDDIDTIRGRLTPTDNSPKTVDGWKELTLKLWSECQQKGYQVGWVWHQLKSKKAPLVALKELERLISADLN